MGLIQNSLNQLTFSILGTAGALGRSFSGGPAKPEEKEEGKVNLGPTFTMPEENYAYTARLGPRAYGKYKALDAVIAGNDLISQKSQSRYSVDERLKGGSK